MKTNFIIFAILLQTGVLFSTTAVYTATNTPASWNTAANWTPNTFPNAIGDTANLNSSTVPASPTVNLNVPITVGALTLDLGTGYTIAPNGGSLTFQASSGSAILGVTVSNGNGAHTITSPIFLNSSLLISQSSTGALTLGPGAISGSQSLSKFGTGPLVLTGNNSYSGGTTISGGTLSASADANFGSAGATLTISNAILQMTATYSIARPIVLSSSASIDVTTGNTGTLSNAVSGGGSLTKTDAGTLVLTSTSNNYSGGTIIGGGTLSISNDQNLGNSSSSLSIASATMITTAGITSTRSGAILGAAVIDSGGAHTNSFSGSFSGAGSLTLQGGGTFILTGNNSYIGGTTLATGTSLQTTTSGLPGNIVLSAASSSLTFSQNSSGTYSGAISGPGTLLLTGTGAKTFTGDSSGLSGATTVSQGSLIVNGSLANSTLNVQSGALLGGSGTVGPTTNSGTISPGNSIGTITVNGNLVLNSSSNILNEIAPLSTDLIAVTGTASINGSLTISPLSGFYGFSASYTVLTSAGLLNVPPGFSSVTSTNSNFVPTVSYTGTSVNLSVQVLRPFAVFPFSNTNTAAVGNNLDDIYQAGQLSADLKSVLNQFTGQSFSAINSALDQMHPGHYSEFTEMQAEVDSKLVSIFHRMPYLPCCCRNPNRIWVEPFGSSLTLKHHGMQIGSQGNTGGVAFGYDGECMENLILGFGGAWSNSHLNWHEHRGHGEVNGYYGAGYCDYQIGGFYIGAAFLAGVDFYDTERHINFFYTDRVAKAKYKALDLTAQLQTAYLFGAPAAFFYPFANFDLIYHNTHAFSETGANGLDLNVQAYTDTTLRTEIGVALQVQDTNMAETMCFSPKVAIYWSNMCPLQRDSFKSTFAGASIPFSTYGWDQNWNLFSADFGLTTTYKCYSLALEYSAEISPDEHTTLFNQYGNVRLDWKW